MASPRDDVAVRAMLKQYEGLRSRKNPLRTTTEIQMFLGVLADCVLTPTRSRDIVCVGLELLDSALIGALDVIERVGMPSLLIDALVGLVDHPSGADVHSALVRVWGAVLSRSPSGAPLLTEHSRFPEACLGMLRSPKPTTVAKALVALVDVVPFFVGDERNADAKTAVVNAFGDLVFSDEKVVARAASFTFRSLAQNPKSPAVLRFVGGKAPQVVTGIASRFVQDRCATETRDDMIQTLCALLRWWEAEVLLQLTREFPSFWACTVKAFRASGKARETLLHVWARCFAEKAGEEVSSALLDVPGVAFCAIEALRPEERWTLGDDLAGADLCVHYVFRHPRAVADALQVLHGMARNRKDVRHMIVRDETACKCVAAYIRAPEDAAGVALLATKLATVLARESPEFREHVASFPGTPAAIDSRRHVSSPLGFASADLCALLVVSPNEDATHSLQTEGSI